jgi:hypothetical protein
MWFSFGQRCEAVPDGRKQRLVTADYRYALAHGDATEPIWRWEYLKRRPSLDDRWCRHHVQGDIPVRMGNNDVSMNDLHLPTGYVTIEEIIRFCIVDLEVKPLSDDWDRILDESYQQFKDDAPIARSEGRQPGAKQQRRPRRRRR